MPPKGLISFLSGKENLALRVGFAGRSSLIALKLFMASEAREIVKRHSRVLDMQGVPVPPMERYRGREATVGRVEPVVPRAGLVMEPLARREE